MTFATLRALHAVIGAAIDDIERIYHERSLEGVALEYPSLDEPYYHAAHHTPEEELAARLKGDPTVELASKQIVAACAQLSTTVNKPWAGLTENMLWVRRPSPWRLGYLVSFLDGSYRPNSLLPSDSSKLHTLSRYCARQVLGGFTSERSFA